MSRQHRVAVSVYFFLHGCLFASWASRIPTVKDKFNLNEAQLGALLFMLPIGSFLALPLAGWWVNKLGSRVTSLIAAIAYSVLFIALGYCHTLTPLYFVLFGFGFFADTFNIAINTQGLDVQTIY